jgi:hypothetical protein
MLEDICSKSNSTTAEYVAPANETWMKKKSNHASLAQQNGFGSALLHSFWRLVKCIAKHDT